MSEPVLGRVARERVLAKVAAGGGEGRTAEHARVCQRARGDGRGAGGTAGDAGASGGGVESLGERRRGGRGGGRGGAGEAVTGSTGSCCGGSGAPTPSSRAAQALDALRLEPGLWGATPVLMYGFDDFGALQLDVIETLGSVVDARVTVSLTYEPGRTAFGGRAGTFETLRPLAGEHRHLQARAEYYAPGGAGGAAPPGALAVRAGAGREEAAGAVRLLEGGGERAELELVAGEVRALLDEGIRPEEIAVVHRTPSAVAELLGEVFVAHEVPYALSEKSGFANTAIGGALVGALRSTTDAGEVQICWHGCDPRACSYASSWPIGWRRRRTRGGEQRGAGAGDLGGRALAVGGARSLGRGGPPRRRALCERAMRELEWLFNAPRRGSAVLLKSDELDEARALAAGRRALTELGGLASGVPELGVDAAELARVLEGLRSSAASGRGRAR